MKQDPPNGNPKSSRQIGRNSLFLLGTDTIEVYVNKLGQVTLRQTHVYGETHVINISPGDVLELIKYQWAKAKEAKRLLGLSKGKPPLKLRNPMKWNN